MREIIKIKREIISRHYIANQYVVRLLKIITEYPAREEDKSCQEHQESTKQEPHNSGTKRRQMLTTPTNHAQ